MFGKEWQRVQKHVHTRTSTQARSHAQKFFVKLEKKNLSLEDFLRDLDLEALERSLLNPETMNSTNYNEEDAVNEVARKRLGQASVSVMNAALPPNPVANLEEKKVPSDSAKRNARKRLRPEVEAAEEASNTYSAEIDQRSD